MRKIISAVGVTALLFAVLAIVAPTAALAASVTSCDGELAAGSYGRVVVPEDGVCLSEGPVTIRGGLEVGPGATLVLGSEENPVDTGTISGGVRATHPASVQIHFVTINGGVDIRGGSGEFGGPFDLMWNAIEDNLIHGGVFITDYDGFWFGFIRNDVRGGVTLTNNVSIDDADSNEFVTNTIRGSLKCSGNSPAPQVGDSEGEPNVVTGQKLGQCADL